MILHCSKPKRKIHYNYCPTRCNSLWAKNRAILFQPKNYQNIINSGLGSFFRCPAFCYTWPAPIISIIKEGLTVIIINPSMMISYFFNFPYHALPQKKANKASPCSRLFAYYQKYAWWDWQSFPNFLSCWAESTLTDGLFLSQKRLTLPCMAHDQITFQPWMIYCSSGVHHVTSDYSNLDLKGQLKFIMHIIITFIMKNTRAYLQD